MKYFNRIFWIVLIVSIIALFERGSCAKLYILEENSINKVVPFQRLRRQTHPAATIAKLPTQDNVFIPIVGPTQSIDQNSNIEFSNSDTLVDYLLPPNPNAQITSLNFQDPSANLQNIDNFFDVTSPSSSSSNNVNSFFQNNFPSSPSSFPSQINVPVSTTQNPVSDQIQSVSFQNPPLSPPTPSLLSSPSQSSNINQFIQNKDSNSLNREASSLFNNQFKPPSQFRSNNFKSDPVVLDQNQGKWELGFDANDILAPPQVESGRVNEYDTINVNKFKKTNIQPSPPNVNLESPSTIQNNFSPPNQFTPNQFTPPPNNLFSQPNQFTPNNQFFSNQFPQQNFPINQPNNVVQNQFTPTNSQFNPTNQATPNQIPVPHHFSPNKDNIITSDQTDVVWGSQKQQNFNPTTAAPFLPTIPPNTNQNSGNFQNGFNNNQNQNLQQFPSTQLNNDQIFQFPNNLNQNNFALDTPLTSQFDSFLPQGTVSDHSFFPINDNVRHFHKRQVDDEYEHDEEEPHEETKSKVKVGPVYSFVKTDKNGHFKWSVRHPSRR